METRGKFQDLYDGLGEDQFEFFTIENDGVFMLGLDMGGRVMYYAPIDDRTTYCLLGVNFISSLIDTISEMSGPRLEALAPGIPTFLQALSDCIDERYDRGAFIKISNYWFLARKVDFGIIPKMKENEEDPFSVLADDILIGVIGDLYNLVSQMVEEFGSFEGLGTWDEIKVAFKESLPGVRLALNISRLFN